MKVLVTGATGFLGGALLRRLKSMQVDVTALGRNPLALQQLLAGGIPVVKADLANAAAVLAACQDQEIVFHCGALSSPWGPYQDFYRSNVLGTQNVIRACRAAAVQRLVYVSTPSIYFRFDSRLNVRKMRPPPGPPTSMQPVNFWPKKKSIRLLTKDCRSLPFVPAPFLAPAIPPFCRVSLTACLKTVCPSSAMDRPSQT